MTSSYNSSEIWKLNIWWLYPEWSILRLDRMGKRENKKSNYLCFEITATILFENTLWVPSRWFLRSKQSLSQIWHLNAFLESTLSLLRATSWKGWFNKLKTSKSKNTIRQRVLNLCKLNWICKEQTYFFTNKIHTPGCKALHSFDAPLRDGPLCLWLENCRWCNRPFLMGKFSPEKYQSITTFKLVLPIVVVPHLNWKRIQDLIFPFVGIRI